MYIELIKSGIGVKAPRPEGPYRDEHCIQLMSDGSICSVSDDGMVHAIWDEQHSQWDPYTDEDGGPVHVSGWDE